MAATLFSVFSIVLGVTLRLVMSQLTADAAWGLGHGAGYGGMGYGGGSGLSPGASKPRSLTCAVEQNTGNSLRVTVKERKANSGLFGLGSSPHLILSHLYGALTGLGAGPWGMQEGGLDIDIEVFLLRNIPTAYFALTEFASPTATCPAKSFGKILSPSGDGDHSYGYAGMPKTSLLHGGFVPAHAAGSLRNPSQSTPGIVTKAHVKAQTSQTLRVTQLQGFQLDDLAGRGFVVCDSISYDWDWRPVCDTPMVDICCGLTYSNGASADSGYITGYSSSRVVSPLGFGQPLY